MFNFLNRASRIPIYPVIEFGFRGEDIRYTTENDSVDIGFTSNNGNRLYLDFTHWRGKKIISKDDKEIILSNCIKYCNKGLFNKIIVVINSDIDKDFWLSACAKHESEIKAIEYTSKDENRKILLNMFMQQIRLHGKVRISDVDYFNENELIEYLKNHDSK